MGTESASSRGVGGGPSFGIDEAILAAVHGHRGHVDQDGKPYILHSLRVVHSFPAADEDAHGVAILHDVVEDTAIPLHDHRGLGLESDAADAVDLLTHRPGAPKSDYGAMTAANPLVSDAAPVAHRGARRFPMG